MYNKVTYYLGKINSPILWSLSIFPKLVFSGFVFPETTIGFRLRFRPKPKKWFPTLTNLILVTFTFYFLFRKENELTKSSYVAHKVMNPWRLKLGTIFYRCIRSDKLWENYWCFWHLVMFVTLSDGWPLSTCTLRGPKRDLLPL